ncbi:transposase [Streptomyces sp. GbtcB7]|uniref:transposase n=1 Tax=Streptomyces sp. GbtcB7 TaxID=2824752 RepID=UPI001C2F552E|nr:transposase [Streptomyces sp. GbtcB7]
MGSKDEPGPVESEHQVRTGAELARIAEKNRDLAEELVERARRDGLQFVGESGLLTGLVKLVLEGALEAEMAEHLGYEKGDPADAGSGNHRNGTSHKTVLSQVGPVTIDIPHYRAGSFTPQIVPKHARRVEGFTETIVSLYAKGLTTGETRPTSRRSTTWRSPATWSPAPLPRSPRTWPPGAPGRWTASTRCC